MSTISSSLGSNMGALLQAMASRNEVADLRQSDNSMYMNAASAGDDEGEDMAVAMLMTQADEVDSSEESAGDISKTNYHGGGGSGYTPHRQPKNKRLQGLLLDVVG